MSKSVPQLTEKASIATGDLFHIVRSNVDYKIKIENIFSGVSVPTVFNAGVTTTVDLISSGGASVSTLTVSNSNNGNFVKANADTNYAYLYIQGSGGTNLTFKNGAGVITFNIAGDNTNSNIQFKDILYFSRTNNTILMSMTNTGIINLPVIQTGNAGLASGDLYVDTAANILANGDKIVGKKA